MTHQATVNRYSSRFEAFLGTVPFRPPRRTPRPRIAGTQTALVVGKQGEEIWTDQYGRITVQFHWDREGQLDENSSCWVRVAQGWAGQNWGSQFIPRVGHEVVVTFLEGDPDRPLITGAVYNASQTVPYALPDESTKSTIKSNSSKGGGGSNELRFEDKKGEEEVYVHAQKDLQVKVLNDETRTVTQNRTTTIEEGNDTLTVSQGNRTVTVSTGNETHDVQGTRDLTVTGAETHTSQAGYEHTVTGDFKLTVSGNLTIEVSGSVTVKSGQSMQLTSLQDLTAQATQNLTNKAGISMTNEAGVSSDQQGVGLADGYYGRRPHRQRRPGEDQLICLCTWGRSPHTPSSREDVHGTTRLHGRHATVQLRRRPQHPHRPPHQPHPRSHPGGDHRRHCAPSQCAAVRDVHLHRQSHRRRGDGGGAGGADADAVHPGPDRPLGSRVADGAHRRRPGPEQHLQADLRLGGRDQRHRPGTGHRTGSRDWREAPVIGGDGVDAGNGVGGSLEGVVVDRAGGLVRHRARYAAGLLEGESLRFGEPGVPLFALDPGLRPDLERGALAALRPAFEQHGVRLSDEALILVDDPGVEWRIAEAEGTLTVRRQDDGLPVYPGRVVERTVYARGEVLQRFTYEGGRLQGRVVNCRAPAPGHGPLFTLPGALSEALEAGDVKALVPACGEAGHPLREGATISTLQSGREWFVAQEGQTYSVRLGTRKRRKRRKRREASCWCSRGGW